MIWVVVALGAIGIGAGVYSWNSPPVWRTLQAVSAIIIGGNLLFMAWLWSRAKPGSGDAIFLPGSILLSVSMLVGIVPRIFWPYETVLIVSSFASMAMTGLVVVSMLRRSRRLAATRSR